MQRSFLIPGLFSILPPLRSLNLEEFIETSADVSEVFFNIVIDYRMIKVDGVEVLKVFELGPGNYSNPLRPTQLHGKNQIQKSLEFAEKLAEEKQAIVYHNRKEYKESKHACYNIAMVCDPDEYEKVSNGIIVSAGDATYAYTRLSMRDKEDILVMNKHLLSVMFIKLLFYYHCNRTPGLKEFIPFTHFFNQYLINWIKPQLHAQNYVVKLPNATRAEGFMRLKLSEFEWKTISKNVQDSETFQRNPACLLVVQEAADGDKVLDPETKVEQERTRRVFVTVHGFMDKPETLKVEISLPYYSIGTKEGVEDPNTKKFFKLELNRDEMRQIEEFIRKLLISLYDPVLKRFPHQWESMVKEFVTKHETFSAEEREQLLALMFQAFSGEPYYNVEKINPGNIGSLKKLCEILTKEEHEKLHLAFIKFFTHTLIGHEFLLFPKQFANPGLIEVFKMHLMQVSSKTFDQFLEYLQEVVIPASPNAYENKTILDELLTFMKSRFCTYMPRLSV